MKHDQASLKGDGSAEWQRGAQAIAQLQECEDALDRRDSALQWPEQWAVRCGRSTKQSEQLARDTTLAVVFNDARDTGQSQDAPRAALSAAIPRRCCYLPVSFCAVGPRVVGNCGDRKFDPGWVVLDVTFDRVRSVWGGAHTLRAVLPARV
jgi:hypothetical protein